MKEFTKFGQLKDVSEKEVATVFAAIGTVVAGALKIY